MCNACHFACCATDCVDGCGCDDCLHWECWGDDAAATRRPTMPTRVSSLEALEAENAALRGTLERFADRKNWTLIDLNGDHAMAWAAPEQHGQPADEARAALVPSAAADLLAAVREAAGALEAIVKVAKGLHVEALEIAREPGDEATIERARAARARLTPWAP